MQKTEFQNWMIKKGKNKKVDSDTISRLKRIEKELENCNIDVHYQNDRCEYLMRLFLKQGKNEEMKKYPHANFPIGKYYMSTYRLALKHYVAFCDEIKLNNE